MNLNYFDDVVLKESGRRRGPDCGSSSSLPGRLLYLPDRRRRSSEPEARNDMVLTGKTCLL